MAGITPSAIFGSSTVDLAAIHAVAVTNNAHILPNGKKLVPTVFNAAHYDTFENIFMLIQAAAYAFAQNNPKKDTLGAVISPRMFDVLLYSSTEATSEWDPSIFAGWNQILFTNYWTITSVDGYDPSAD